MRKVIFYSIAAMLITAPMATAAKAEDTTIIKRDHDGDRKVIEKREKTDLLPVPLAAAQNSVTASFLASTT